MNERANWRAVAMLVSDAIKYFKVCWLVDGYSPETLDVYEWAHIHLLSMSRANMQMLPCRIPAGWLQFSDIAGPTSAAQSVSPCMRASFVVVGQ